MRARFVEVQISNDKVRGMFGDRCQRRITVGEGQDLVPLLAQQFGDHLDHGQIVIHQEHFRH